MKKIIIALTLALTVSGTAFASFPVTSSKSNTDTKTTVVTDEATEETAISTEETINVSETSTKSDVIDASEEKSVDDNTIAIILAIVSVLILPFGLHNWFLGRKKQALWQTLLVIPGFILIVPPLVSWIWQIVDLIRLLTGDLPS